MAKRDIQSEFRSNYLVHLKQVIPGELCNQWVADYFNRTGVVESDPTTFPNDGSVFAEQTRSVAFKEVSPAAWEVICELLGGEEMIDERTKQLTDNFNLNFNRGADEKWQPPSASSPGWHKDGDFFRHFLDSPEQALLCLVIWREIGPRSGGTFFAPDSVPLICHELLAHPEGLPHNHKWMDFIHQCKDFREVNAGVGDVIILHPFVLHAASQNHSGRIRFMNNMVVSLKQPMRFHREDGKYSALEASILDAIGVESLDYYITGERFRSEDFSTLRV